MLLAVVPMALVTRKEKMNKPYTCYHCNSPLLRWIERSEIIEINFMVKKRVYTVECAKCELLSHHNKIWWSDEEPAMKDIDMAFRYRVESLTNTIDK